MKTKFKYLIIGFIIGFIICCAIYSPFLEKRNKIIKECEINHDR